jgi:exonuclease VII small subunit
MNQRSGDIQRMGICRWLPMLLMLMLGSCGGDTSRKQAQAEKTLHSWAVTVRMAANQFADGEVPAQYLRQTLEAARRDVEQAAQQLEGTSAAKEFQPKARAFEDRLQKLSSAARKEDRNAVRQLAGTDALATTVGQP